MGKNETTAGPIARRVFELLRRLPPAIQDEVFLAIQNLAFFVLLFVAFPVLIAVFVAMTIAYALLNWALGAPTGFLGAALAYAWLGAIVTLPVVITVRMWRALPILVRLKKLAIDGPDRDYEALAPAVPSNTTVPLSVQERIAIAVASLEPGSDEATRPVKPPP
jgi:hypothetical protein